MGTDDRPTLDLRRLMQTVSKIVTVENIVAKNERTWRAADKLLTNNQRLRQAIRRRLHSILKAHAPLLAGAEQALEERRVRRGGDDQNLANSGEHQYRQRVVNHRLV